MSKIDELKGVPNIWWHAGRTHSLAEKIADGIVHGVGLLISIVFGTALLFLAFSKTAPMEFPALIVYVVSLVTLLSVSMTFNLLPRNDLKGVFARLDQAAIFFLIAGTYTPFLALIWDTPSGVLLTSFVWGAALIGIALKLLVPQHFGRVAIVLYLAIGWSGIFVFQGLAAALPSNALWLMVAGGVTYSLGIIFHLWEKMKFHKAVWHTFVVVAAILHLMAIFDAMVLSR